MSFSYSGRELDLFAQARHWKQYVASRVRPHLGRRVLEVGAGVGGTTRALIQGASFDSWTCLEPDPLLARRVREAIARKELPQYCRAMEGSLGDMPPEERFDAIIYIDVLEHIENDKAELELALARLSPGGRLVVLSPAFMCLYSPFDAEVGHFRRYRKEQLAALRPDGALLVSCTYLDPVGFLASLANKLFLRQKDITLPQVLFWDRFMIPLSQVLDPVLKKYFGKSVLAVFCRI